ncbi:MAG: ClpXP protease specificity-enhancing factor SspB [Hyphomicrobiaceae bacterium]
MTASQYIDYDALALEALRGVVKACLAQVARTGLVGEHHFYIAFNTQAPGVAVSKRLKEKYPQEMTIVLQHRFWDLAVSDDKFEVKLTFDGILERLVVPFKAIMVFYDPSVPYGLQFGEAAAAGQQQDGVRGGTRGPVELGKSGARQPRGLSENAEGEVHDETHALSEPRRPRAPKADRTPDNPARPAHRDQVISDDVTEQSDLAVSKAPKAAPAKPAAVVAVVDGDEAGDGSDGETTEAGDGSGAGGAKIFDLAKFRSKK